MVSARTTTLAILAIVNFFLLSALVRLKFSPSYSSELTEINKIVLKPSSHDKDTPKSPAFPDAGDTGFASTPSEVAESTTTRSIGLRGNQECSQEALKKCNTLDDIEKVHEQSRCLLNRITQWIAREDWSAALYQYGLPGKVFGNVVKDVGEPVNLSDLVGFLTKKVKSGNAPSAIGVNYMEMGVSVGKTLYQTLNTACGSNVVAFDIERINPTFHRMLSNKLGMSLSATEPINGHEFLGTYTSRKEDKCNVKSYKGDFRENSFYYVNCDEFDLVGWKGIRNLVKKLSPANAKQPSFQVIFSDAMHTKQAIDFELDRIFELELLDKENFAYVWDDMGALVPPFCDRIVGYADAKVKDKIWCVIARLPGWMGTNEHQHEIAVITTVDIHNLVEKHMTDFKYIRRPGSQTTMIEEEKEATEGEDETEEPQVDEQQENKVSNDDDKAEEVTSAGTRPEDQCSKSGSPVLKKCGNLDAIEKVHEQSRCLLNRITQWIAREDWSAALYQYGLPGKVFGNVVKDVGEPVNLSDLVGFLTKKVKSGNAPSAIGVNYMEMGVSVGKTLYQTLNTACGSNVVAFDIERINPTFHRMLSNKLGMSLSATEPITGHEFLGTYTSRKEDKCNVKSYKGDFRENSFYYVNCDEFDLVGWKGIRNLVKKLSPANAKQPSFQVIFSDAMHTKQAIDFELDRIFELELLDKENFAYVWDDMGALVPPFCDRIVGYADAKVKDKIWCVIARLPGWMGTNEHQHEIAVITTVDIHNLVEKHMTDFKYIRRPGSQTTMIEEEKEATEGEDETEEPQVDEQQENKVSNDDDKAEEVTSAGTRPEDQCSKSGSPVLKKCGNLDAIEKVHEQSRCLLNRITQWIAREDWSAALYQYGLPGKVFGNVVKDVGEPVNLSDLVGFLTKKVKSGNAPSAIGVNYMEMGVSVGKTLYQTLNTACGSNVVAFDIERINPTFHRMLSNKLGMSLSATEPITGHEFLGTYTSRKEDKCNVKSYKGDFRENSFYYVNCDEFDLVGWKGIRNLVKKLSPANAKQPSFQVIFSDAMHTKLAIDFELDRIFELELLDKENFAYVWDDMGALVPPFCDRIVGYADAKVKDKIWCVIARLPGWMGTNEHQHEIAVITTVDIHNLVEKHMTDFKYIRRPGSQTTMIEEEKEATEGEDETEEPQVDEQQENKVSNDDDKAEEVTSAGTRPEDQCSKSGSPVLKKCGNLDAIEKVHEQSRCLLNRITQWIAREDWSAALYQYGLPGKVFGNVVKDVGEPVNLSDLVGFLTKKVKSGNAPSAIGVNYMEMGVSVGKTLYQTLNTACGSNVVAFDIERINPTFHRMLSNKLGMSLSATEPINGHEFLGTYTSRKEDKCNVKSYKGDFRENSFYYVNCDEFDLVGWKGIRNLVKKLSPANAKQPSFQVIFSDAMHTKQAIDFELDRIFELELLDKENFAYVWDDMGALVPPFCDRIVGYADAKVKDKIWCVIARLPGWMGTNEHQHEIAVITTVDIQNLVEKHMTDFKYIRRPGSQTTMIEEEKEATDNDDEDDSGDE